MTTATGQPATGRSAAEGCSGPRILRGELACLRCGNDALEAVPDGLQTVFRCRRCGTCWRVSLGWMAPVPDRTTPDRTTPDRTTPDRTTPDRTTHSG